MRLRQTAGALVYDWPRFARCLAGRGQWTRFRNRNEQLTIDEATGGVRCEWEFSSDLHLCNVSSLATRLLLARALGEWPILFADAPVTAGEPRVTFIIGHRGESRLPLLQATVASIAAQRGVAVECIVVEQSARPQLEGRLPSWVRTIHTPIESDALPYNRAWTFNAGAPSAAAPLLVLHDNDFLVPADYARELVRRHDEGWEVIDLKRLMIYLTREASETVARERRIAPDLAVERVTQNLNAGGSVAVDRKTYAELGGFDEAFVGWGGEDNEFWERGETRRAWAFAYLPFVHLWHAPQPEKGGPQMSDAQKRYRESTLIPPGERIARLLAK
jgi:hypothetical protein